MKNEAEILKLLKEKSATKQLIYRNTKEAFDDLVISLKSKEKSLITLLKDEEENVELEFIKWKPQNRGNFKNNVWLKK